MQNSKWWKITLSLSLLMTTFISGVVVLFDPFFQYHKPMDYLRYDLTNIDPSYVNPGIAKNFEYDSVLVGSSMTQNFKISQFDSLFQCNTVKLSYSGGKAKNYKQILDISFATHEIKNVFYGLDSNAYKEDWNKTRNPLPDYLYDDNVFNDVSYIFNKDVIIKNIVKISRDTLKNIESTDMDDYQNWYDASLFGKEKVLETYADKTLLVPEKTQGENLYSKNVRENLDENLIPLIISNPKTNFYFFLPPYSILYWRSLFYRGGLDSEFKLYEIILEELVKYENVKVYQFVFEPEIITDLSLYKDYTHYNETINDLIVGKMYIGSNRLTEENYRLFLNNFRNYLDELNFNEFL